MADKIVRPSVVTSERYGTWEVGGVDASTPAGERLARDFDIAPSAEDLVGVVYEAIEAGVRLWVVTGQSWIQFNPAHVVCVRCRNFDG